MQTRYLQTLANIAATGPTHRLSMPGGNWMNLMMREHETGEFTRTAWQKERLCLELHVEKRRRHRNPPHS